MVIFWYACLFAALYSGHYAQYHQPGWAPSLLLACPAPHELLVQKQHGVSGGRVGCYRSVAFLFQGQPVATENFLMERHWTIISVAAVKNSTVFKLLLNSCSSSRKAHSWSQPYEASLYQAQLLFSSGMAQSIRQHMWMLS